MSHVTPFTLRPNLRPLVALMMVHTIAMSGRTLAQFAIPLFVLITTGSSVKTAVIGVCVLLPLIGGAVLGGSVVDRIGPQRASALADCGTAITLGSIPLLYATGWLSFPLLMGVVLLSAMFDSPALAARDALTPELASNADVPLERINSAVQVIENGATLLGPITAGVLIFNVGPSSALYAAAAVFLLSAVVMLGLLPAPRLPASGRQQIKQAGLLADLRVGWQFIARTPCLLATAIIVGSLYALIEPIFLVVLPAYSQLHHIDADDLGKLYAALGSGLLLSSLAYGSYGHAWNRRWVLVCGICSVAIGLVVVALLPTYSVILSVMFLVGLPAGTLAPLLFTVMQEVTPAPLRGRVFSTMTALCLAGTPIAVMVSGFAMEHLRLETTLAMLASGFTAITLTVLLGGSYRLIDSQTAQQAGIPVN